MTRIINILLTLPLILAVSFLTPASFNAKVYASEYSSDIPKCDIDTDLQGTLNKNHAIVTNYSKNPSCTYKATLALYDVPLAPGAPRWIDSQTLLKFQTVTVDPGKTLDVVVDSIGPSCRIQSDLIRGEYILEPPFYANAMDVAVYEVPCEIAQVVPTSTPTPSSASASVSTPTPTPTNTSSQAATSTPSPGPTATPTPGSSTSQTSSPGVLALTGNAAFIYAVIISGAASLISGLILRKLSK